MYKGKKRPQPGKKQQPRAEKSRDYAVKEQAELLPFLLQHITGAGRNVVKAILANGQVAVSGKPVTAYNYALQPGQIVTVSKERPKQGIPFMGLTILFEDEHVIVIKKDAGLLSVASDRIPK
jgi:23S rRNA pseudouridine1911/1915/1917 synthase